MSIKLIDTKDHLLSCYDRAISDYTGEFFKRQGIQVLGESHVRSQLQPPRRPTLQALERLNIM